MNSSSGIIDLIFPEKCPFCGRMKGRVKGPADVLCDRCSNELFIYDKADELPHEALEKVLRLYVPLRYSGAAKKAMLRYKFGQEQWLYRPFSQIMHIFLEANDGYSDIDVITCVPVSAKRFAQRGYDQSRLIARAISGLSGKPFRDLLRRNDTGWRNIATSTENFAQRASERRFSASRDDFCLFGTRILLVDDIFTTGSTLNECAGILLEHGALYVNAACMMSGRQDIYAFGREESA
ncbi:MAG: ComF family protein [Clostridia bacterium]|nr:ComF family protein [Clostridia bacterium]